MARPNKPSGIFPNQARTSTTICLSSPTCKQESLDLRIFIHAWARTSFPRLGGIFVMTARVASFSLLSIFYEAIQWFHAGGNFVLATDFSKDRSNCPWYHLRSWHCRDVVKNHDNNLVFDWLKSYIISGAPRGTFQQPVYNKCKVRWLRVLARPLQAVYNGFLSETLNCALS